MLSWHNSSSDKAGRKCEYMYRWKSGVCEDLFLPGFKFLNDYNKHGHQLRMKRFEERIRKRMSGWRKHWTVSSFKCPLINRPVTSFSSQVQPYSAGAVEHFRERAFEFKNKKVRATRLFPLFSQSSTVVLNGPWASTSPETLSKMKIAGFALELLNQTLCR